MADSSSCSATLHVKNFAGTGVVESSTTSGGVDQTCILCYKPVLICWPQ